MVNITNPQNGDGKLVLQLPINQVTKNPLINCSVTCKVGQEIQNLSCSWHNTIPNAIVT